MGSSNTKNVNPEIVIAAGHSRSYSGGSDINNQICIETQWGLLRSCNLAGQSQTQQCAWHPENLNLHVGAISIGGMPNIIHMAEAIYQAMDDINGQSLSLLSQTSSVPAPCEVVEALSVKLYNKLQKHFNQEDPQCYICLVEYEVGDEVRMLPCHHEFHKGCIDEWLRNVHRICPVCRDDVCKSGLSNVKATSYNDPFCTYI